MRILAFFFRVFCAELLELELELELVLLLSADAACERGGADSRPRSQAASSHCGRDGPGFSASPSVSEGGGLWSSASVAPGVATPRAAVESSTVRDERRRFAC